MLNPNTNLIYLNNEEYIKYSKHLTIDNIGINGQKRLKKAKILVIGAGGLGCPALLYLIASGIGYIGIVDNDNVELSNLNRQILYNKNDINKSKTVSAKNKLRLINKKCKIIKHQYYINAKNCSEIIQYYDIIIDATDNFKTRYQIDKFCYKMNKIHIYGAIEKFEGQIAIFNYKHGIRYQDIYNNLKHIQNNNCNENGVIGITTGYIGILQAVEAIKIILGIIKINNNSLIIYNLLSSYIKKIKIYDKKNINYQLNNIINNKKIINEINIKNLFIILDIRENHEFNKKHIKNAINIPLINFKLNTTIKFIIRTNYKKVVAIYCNTISRSLIASYILNNHKIKNYIIQKKEKNLI
uniref:Molybdopterin biosynthesis protein n=1 Tax=Sonderella linearis TaxID=110477 RepID=A0A1Z1MMF5_9FLOR|nr:Molybdopterin biosynthesis protein [Sonderella linearis]ARW67116.1 Molybdopterin biosynthesis protein [Sonderella linearis]